MKNIKEILDELNGMISFRQICYKYFKKDSSWLYHKLNEDVLNGVRYRFTENEIDILIKALKFESDNMLKVAESLSVLIKHKQRERGFYPTTRNPFNHPLFEKWFSKFYSKTTIIEPFFGNGKIPMFFKQLGIINEWKCFDIEKPSDTVEHHVIKRDVISNFPKGYKICVTNPPFLSKNSAKRRGLYFPDTKYSDLYMVCLEQMLKHCKYVASILPASYLSTKLFFDRVYGIILLDYKIFETTDCPVCLALFNKNPSDDFLIYQGDSLIGNYNQLSKYLIDPKSGYTKWKFNVPNGEIGVRCCDNSHTSSIQFIRGKEIDGSTICHSSRSFTRISGLPDNIDLQVFIETCNRILNEYRSKTHDIFLTTFKGLRKDGKYRRRIDFKTIRNILNFALESCLSNGDNLTN